MELTRKHCSIPLRCIEFGSATVVSQMFRCMALLNMLTHSITISFSGYWLSHGKSK